MNPARRVMLIRDPTTGVARQQGTTGRVTACRAWRGWRIDEEPRVANGTFPHRALVALSLLTFPVSPHPHSTFAATPPSPDHPVGWRGDGSGRYPDATPSTHWQRLAKTPLTEFRAAARKPAADDAPVDGLPLDRARAAFHPRQWLVLGPLTPDDPAKAIDQELVPGEAALAPDAGQAAGPAAWKSVAVGGSSKNVDLLETFGAADKPEKERLENRAAYACALRLGGGRDRSRRPPRRRPRRRALLDQRQTRQHLGRRPAPVRQGVEPPAGQARPPGEDRPVDVRPRPVPLPRAGPAVRVAEHRLGNGNARPQLLHARPRRRPDLRHLRAQ